MPTLTMEVPKTITVTDLGSGNEGKISASDITGVARGNLLADAEKYRRPCRDSWICVDSRAEENVHVESYVDTEEVYAQGAGGEAVFEPMIDYMLEPNSNEPLSSKVKNAVSKAISRGREVIMHGDTRNEEFGCGALVCKRDALKANAANMDVVAPRAAYLLGVVGIQSVTEEDIVNAIVIGKENAEKDELWDITPEEHVGIAIGSGARYVRLVGDHNEKLADIETTEHGFDRIAFMRDHTTADGDSIGAFAITLGKYKQQVDKEVADGVIDRRQADLRVLGFILFNIAVPKRLTAEERGNGESLPVVVLG